MRFDVFTLLPEVMHAYLGASVLGKAQEAGLLEVYLHNIRDYALDRHHTTDDEPYGGGGGMVMKPEPIFTAVESVLGEAINTTPILLLTPQGRVFRQEVAHELAVYERLALICGRYEGVDERVRQYLATDEISVGDYVLTGGELPALVVIDTIARLQSGVLGDDEATEKDSYSSGLLEHPHYTRPASFRGWDVPEVLLSGDHARIAAWRREQSLRRTLNRRPDLLETAELDKADRSLLVRMKKYTENNALEE
ncbi:MAG: tRNA (guanosine(37)-N1)-methyltransferase TrmD [Anaerolineaceae bacterium]|nr:MAG: tRNA (guanosine(37)-N1)-methyltransferase TrmD [Anaerolineaceae bacterium]